METKTSITVFGKQEEESNYRLCNIEDNDLLEIDISYIIPSLSIMNVESKKTYLKMYSIPIFIHEDIIENDKLDSCRVDIIEAVNKFINQKYFYFSYVDEVVLSRMPLDGHISKYFSCYITGHTEGVML